MDKAFWRSVIDADFAMPEGYEVATLTPELLQKLGSADPEWRDEFAYPVLAQWVHQAYYLPGKLREMMTILLANLRVGLGETDTDSVFLRAFSALTLTEIIAYDNVTHTLDAADIALCLDAGLTYLIDERDLRGFVAEKGWAHAVAHTADLLGALARNRYLFAPDLERILGAFAAKVGEPVPYVYVHLEDERLAYATLEVLRRDLVDTSFLGNWLMGFAHQRDGQLWEAADVVAQPKACGYANTRAFLRSLYFQLTLGAHPVAPTSELPLSVAAALQAMDVGFYV